MRIRARDGTYFRSRDGRRTKVVIVPGDKLAVNGCIDLLSNLEIMSDTMRVDWLNSVLPSMSLVFGSTLGIRNLGRLNIDSELVDLGRASNVEGNLSS
jgi:hypothetical protein